MILTTTLNPTTSLFVIDAQNTGLPENRGVYITSNPVASDQNTEGRLVYIKGTQQVGTDFKYDIYCSTGVTFYPDFTEKTDISPFYCVTLLEYPSNKYNIVSYYENTLLNSFINPTPGTAVVNATGESSILFVDLRTQSKVVTLPSIRAMAESETQSPYFLIKDAYGNATTNALYLSSFNGDTIEARKTCLVLASNFNAIEIAGDAKALRWHILSYYSP